MLSFISSRRILAALTLCLAAWSQAAVAAPIPFGNRSVSLTAREQPAPQFLKDLFGSIDMPVNVSPKVTDAVNGVFNGSAETVYRQVAKSLGLVEYYDGSVVWVYPASEISTRTLPVSSAVAQRVVSTASDLRMTDGRNTIRTTREGALIVAGVRRFIEQVEELTRAQAATSAAQPPLNFRVFYLRYAWAGDTSMTVGGRQVVLPGVASMVRALMTSNPRSQVYVQPNEQTMRPTVPKLKGQGLGGVGGGTLGAADANPQLSSAEALIAAYGAGALLQGLQPGSAPGAAGAAAGSGAPVSLGAAGPVRVEADSRLNAVVVRDAPERLPLYEQLIAALDVEPQPLEIEATIVDVDTERMRELGINWRASRGRGSVLFGNGTESDRLLNNGVAPADITPVGKGGFASLVLGGANEFIARLNALQDQGAAKIVSSPQVLTLSNVEAFFDSSQQFYVRVAGREEVDLFPVSAGTTLRVTPHVFKDGDQARIKLLVAINDDVVSQERVDQIPVVQRASINTQALIDEGQSLLIGGLTRDATSTGSTKVPVLGDIPIIGRLFSSTRDASRRTERMFLISPRLASARQTAAAPAASPYASQQRTAPVPAPASAAVAAQAPVAMPTPAPVLVQPRQPAPAASPVPAAVTTPAPPAAPSPALPPSPSAKPSGMALAAAPAAPPAATKQQPAGLKGDAPPSQMHGVFKDWLGLSEPAPKAAAGVATTTASTAVGTNAVEASVLGLGGATTPPPNAKRAATHPRTRAGDRP
jgi:type III secretion protein C